MEPRSGGGWLRVGGRVVGSRIHDSLFGGLVWYPDKLSPARDRSRSFAHYSTSLRSPRTCRLRLFLRARPLPPLSLVGVGDSVRTRRRSQGRGAAGGTGRRLQFRFSGLPSSLLRAGLLPPLRFWVRERKGNGNGRRQVQKGTQRRVSYPGLRGRGVWWSKWRSL